MAKRKSVVPDNEKPAARFKRVVEPRVGKAIKAITLVGSVTGSAYKYTPDDIVVIQTALEDAVEKAIKRLSGVGDTSSGFKLR